MKVRQCDNCGTGNGYDRIGFSWTNGADVSQPEIGSPQTTTGYGICVYEELGENDWGIFLDSDIPAGYPGCRNFECWTHPNSATWRYRSKNRTPDGIYRGTIVVRPDGASKILFKGKGVGLQLHRLPLTQNTRVVAQLVNDLGSCWSSTYTFPARSNVATSFADRCFGNDCKLEQP